MKGSHIVVPRLYAHDRSYIFQNADGRVCFAIPYEQDFTLIGTTDEDYRGDPGRGGELAGRGSAICAARSAPICATPVDPADIVWRYAGVRPLLDDGASKAQEATRDYVLVLEAAVPLLSVFGGKITTYRRLAEAAMAKLARLLPGHAWRVDGARRVAGRRFSVGWHEQVRADLARRYPFLSDAQQRRFVRTYGTLSADDARRCTQAGRHGALLRRRPHRARGRLAGPHRMGAAPPKTCSGGAASLDCASVSPRHEL